MIQKERVWIQLAVNKEAWKTGDPRRWRVFIEPERTPTLVTALTCEGRATPDNLQTQTLDTRDERDVVAYIRYFGNIKIENDRAFITLLDPAS